MPKLRIVNATFGKVSQKAIFIAALMLFNIVFSTLSSAVTYADTGEATTTEEVVAEEETTTEEESDDSEVTESETTTEEPTEETTEEVVAEETEEVATEESTEDPATEVPVEEVTTTEVEEETTEVAKAEEEVELETEAASFEHQFIVGPVCWASFGAGFIARIQINAEESFTVDEGSLFNHTTDGEYDEIMPTEFEEGTFTYEISEWDGEAFTWTIGNQTVEINATITECEIVTTLDLLEESPEHSMVLNALVNGAESNEVCGGLLMSLSGENGVDTTFFAPTNEAFSALIGSPASTSDELIQLMGNPDELCSMLARHMSRGRALLTSDVAIAPWSLAPFARDANNILVEMIGEEFIVDGYARIISADNLSDYGVFHSINQLLLPTSIGTIDPVVTDKTSPALSGSIVPFAYSESEELPSLCVLVRVDGTPYIADVDGYNWSIEAGVVTLNPTKSDTLFDIVVRNDGAGTGCANGLALVEVLAVLDTDPIGPVRSGFGLLGVTMQRGAVSYLVPEEPVVEDEGMVLGTVTETPVAAPVAEATTTPVAACGKGACGYVAQVDLSTIDSDGDGVVDSEDPAPYDATITGLEDTTEDSSSDNAANDDDSDDKDTNGVFWWFLIGGAATVGTYLYRQRNGA